MSTKKIVSLLTLLFLFFFLIVTAFPDDDPITDADPWNETSGDEPIPQDESGFKIIYFKTVLFPPYFFIMYEKIPAPPSSTVTRGCKSTHSKTPGFLSK
jgi:hypothetical protein